ncbi:hypothetical protein HBI83_065430 [Parastagonospora nodorum]|nr:hypothetical protein HBI83_065430 [Parastagonospora nodorum]
MTTPKRPQSATGDTPSTSQYHSAYNGYVADQGRFMHFIRSPDQSHLEFGYWCFSTTQDEARAFGRGYHTPEEILIAADSGEGEFADINMLWIPGRVDRVLKSQICGSAKQHTRAIYDMRVFLGKSLSFRGCAPTYPMDQRLEDYWASRRIPASVLTDPPVLQSTNRPPPTYSDNAPAVTGHRAKHRTATDAGAPSVVQRQTAYRSQPYNSTPYGAPAAQSAPCPPVPYNERKPLRTPQSYGVQDLPGSHPRPIAQHNTPGANSTLYSNFELPTMHQTGPMPQQLPSSATITDPRLVGHDQNPGSAAAPIDFSFEDDEPITVAPDEVVVDEGTTTAAGVTTAVRQPAPISEQIEPETRQIKSLQRQLLTDGNDEGRFKRPETSDNRQDSLTTTSDQLPTPDAVLEMPCMDCGEEVEKGHKAGCHLGENSNTFIANPMQANEVTDIAPMKLTVLDHRVLADCVERFDPGPWTTHQGPPAEPELETPEDQIRGMADIIRNEDTYKSDAELCLLPDDLMILAWAMKTAPNIEVICE